MKNYKMKMLSSLQLNVFLLFKLAVDEKSAGNLNDKLFNTKKGENIW